MGDLLGPQFLHGVRGHIFRFIFVIGVCDEVIFLFFFGLMGVNIQIPVSRNQRYLIFRIEILGSVARRRSQLCTNGEDLVFHLLEVGHRPRRVVSIVLNDQFDFTSVNTSFFIDMIRPGLHSTCNVDPPAGSGSCEWLGDADDHLGIGHSRVSR